MNFQLAIHSSPRFATWIWIPDWHILIDAGDGQRQDPDGVEQAVMEVELVDGDGAHGAEPPR